MSQSSNLAINPHHQAIVSGGGESKSRSVHQYSLDLLRIIAIILVVFLHLLPQPISKSFTNDVTIVWQIIDIIIGTTTKICVPLFVIISGYLMIDRDYEQPRKLHRFFNHNYLPMFVSFELWTIFSFIVVKPFTRVSFSGLISTAFFIGNPFMVHFWFMHMMLGLYLLIPAVSTTLRHLNYRYAVGLMLVFIVFSSALPTAVLSAHWFGINLPKSIGNGDLYGFNGSIGLWLVLFVFGYWCRNAEILSKVALHIRSCYLIVSAIVLYLFTYPEYHLSHTTNQIQASFLPVALLSMTVFWTVLGLEQFLRRRSSTLKTILRTSAPYAYGVYMTHLLVSTITHSDTVLRVLSFIPHARILFGNPLTVLLLSFCLCWLLGRITVVRTWLLLIK